MEALFSPFLVHSQTPAPTVSTFGGFRYGKTHEGGGAVRRARRVVGLFQPSTSRPAPSHHPFPPPPPPFPREPSGSVGRTVDFDERIDMKVRRIRSTGMMPLPPTHTRTLIATHMQERRSSLPLFTEIACSRPCSRLARSTCSACLLDSLGLLDFGQLLLGAPTSTPTPERHHASSYAAASRCALRLCLRVATMRRG